MADSPSSKTRKVAIALVPAAALVMGLLQLLPSVFLERAVRGAGQEFLIAQITHHGDTAIHYVPKAREVLDGHFPALDIHVAENRRLLFLWPPGPQLIFAAFLAASDDVNHAYMAAGFFFTAIMFAVFFWLGLTLLESRLGAALFATVGVLTPAVTHLPQAFFSPGLFMDIIGKNFVPLVRTPIHQLFLSRIEFPLLVLWLYGITLVLLYRFFREPTIRRGIAFGLGAGLLNYFYLHAWMYTLVLFGLLAVLAYLRRDGAFLLPWLAAGGIIAVLAVPFAMNYLAFNGLAQASDVVARIGFETGWGFRLSVWRHYVVYAALGILVFALLRKRRHHALVFSLSALAAMVLGLNIQLLLGWNPQPDHWLKVFGLPLFAVSAVVVAEAIRRIAERFDLAKVRLLLVALFLILGSLLVAKKVVNAVRFINPGPAWIAEYSFPRPIVESWQWMNENVRAGSIVLSPSLITSIYLSGYTGADPYLAFAQNTIASDRAIEDRFLTAHKLFATSPERLEWLLEYRKNPFAACEEPCGVHTAMNLSKAPAYLYGQTFNIEFNIFDSLAKEQGVSSYAIPPSKIGELLGRYPVIEPRWEDLGGSYVYVGPWERELGVPANFGLNPALERVYGRDGIEIYRVR